MLLIKKLQNATHNDAQSYLFREIRQLFTSTLTQLNDVYVDNRIINKNSMYIDIINEFEKLYKVLNPRFRNLFFSDTSENNTSINLYTKSYNKRNYIDVVKTAHPEFEFSEVNKYYIKFNYDFMTFWELYKENLTLLYAKHGNNVHYLQIIISYIKVVIENFYLNKVNWQQILNNFNDMINNFDDNEIRYNVISYGKKPARQRKCGIKYNSKTKSMDFEVREMLNAGIKKKDIAAKLKISRMTLDRMIKNNPFLQ